jgi:hypothetical protein
VSGYFKRAPTLRHPLRCAQNQNRPAPNETRRMAPRGESVSAAGEGSALHLVTLGRLRLRATRRWAGAIHSACPHSLFSCPSHWRPPRCAQTAVCLTGGLAAPDPPPSSVPRNRPSVRRGSHISPLNCSFAPPLLSHVCADTRSASGTPALLFRSTAGIPGCALPAQRQGKPDLGDDEAG